jgi:hypothetical protein
MESSDMVDFEEYTWPNATTRERLPSLPSPMHAHFAARSP